MSDAQDICWLQRLDNFRRAAARLQRAVDIPADKLSALEAEGLIQRFGFTFELAWKTASAYLQHQGREFATGSPRDTRRDAFAYGLIEDGAPQLRHRHRALGRARARRPGPHPRGLGRRVDSLAG